MPEIKVTQTLRDTIKKYRKEIHLRGDVLSRTLKKNTSFISQLETGKIENIDTDTLNKIFDCLFEHEQPEMRNRKVDEILNQLQLSLSDNELRRQEWLHIMDLQYRLIPIPNSIIEYINNELQELHLAPEDIITKINCNEGLISTYSQEELDAMEDNKVYYEISESHSNMHIKFNLPADYLSDILSKKTVRCNFINLQAIIYSLFLLKGFSTDDAFDQSEEFLFKNKFYTLLRKQHLPENEPVENYLASYDIDFRKKLDALTTLLNNINDRQPDFLNPILETFITNILKEPSLTLSIISKDVTSLKNMSSDNKRNFIAEYKELITKYANNSVDEQPKIETF